MGKRKLYILQGESNTDDKVIRRTITVEDSLNTAINQIRGILLQKKDIELDFTSAINMLAVLGLRRAASYDLDGEEIGIIKSYLFNTEKLKKESAFDQACDVWLRSELSKLSRGTSKK